MTGRTARPMVEMTGTVTDLQAGDYVDEIGDGIRYRRQRIEALVHRTAPGYLITRKGVVEVPGVEFLGRGERLMTFKPGAPVKFRRFADRVATADERITHH